MSERRRSSRRRRATPSSSASCGRVMPLIRLTISDYGVTDPPQPTGGSVNAIHTVVLSGRVSVPPLVTLGPNPVVAHIEPSPHITAPTREWRLQLLQNGEAQFLVSAPDGYTGPLEFRTENRDWARIEDVVRWQVLASTPDPPPTTPSEARSVWERLGESE